jgi:UrcA family protein
MAQLGRLWIAASVALVLPAVASAQDITITAKKMPNGYEPVTQVVHLADLNLTTSTGVDEMQKRVTSAVNTMCGPVGPVGVRKSKEYQTCSKYAWASAKPQMDNAVESATRKPPQP